MMRNEVLKLSSVGGEEEEAPLSVSGCSGKKKLGKCTRGPPSSARTTETGSNKYYYFYLLKIGAGATAPVTTPAQNFTKTFLSFKAGFH